MKKIILMISLLTVSFVGAKAQIMKFGELPGIIMQSSYDSEIMYGHDGKRHLVIYDEELNVIKKVPKLEISIGYDMIKAFCVAKNLFTNSGKYEFVAQVITDSTTEKHYYGENNEEYWEETTYSYQYGIYNEDGELLFDLGGFATADDRSWVNPFVKAGKLFIAIDSYVDDKKKSSVSVKGSEETEGERYSTKIYKLSGSNAVNNIMQNANATKLFPNPAKQDITLEYESNGMLQELQIMNIQGVVVASYLLDPTQKSVKINTSSYKKGTYIYRYGNNSGKFIVE